MKKIPIEKACFSFIWFEKGGRIECQKKNILRLDKVLDTVEKLGNKVPHPAIIFLILIVIVGVLSHIFI